LKEVELFKTKFQLLKRDPGARQKVRKALKPMLGGIVYEVNNVFEDARTQLKQLSSCYQDFVIIVDNLEKIQRVGEKDVRLVSQRELFIENSRHLTGLNAHLVYTLPLRVARQAAGQLDAYGPLHVLPMIKIEERSGHSPYPAGLDCLRNLLQKRLGDVSVNEFFAPDALNFLLTYSGGHVRNFMSVVQRAVAYADGIPIPLDAAQRALQQTIRNASAGISKRQWELLAALEQSRDQQIDASDTDYLQILENLAIFEYINGSGVTDILTSNRPWYAVNPILRKQWP